MAVDLHCPATRREQKNGESRSASKCQSGHQTPGSRGNLGESGEGECGDEFFEAVELPHG